MKGHVTKMCDPKDVRIPDEMLHVALEPQQVDDALRQLSLRYAQQTQVQQAQTGDIVYCRADQAGYPDGRTVQLYTGLKIPGAEKAANAALGKGIGDQVKTVLADKQVTLQVEKIIRPVPVQVNDALIASMGMDGVATMEAYRQHAESKMLADMKTEKRKMAVSYVLQEMLENSAFLYDEKEYDAYIAEHMDEMLAEYQSYDMDVDEDEIRKGVLEQFKEGWLAEEFCKRSKINVDLTAAEEETDRMMEMMSLMGETVPDRETLLAESISNAYIIEMFKKLEMMVDEKMGG